MDYPRDAATRSPLFPVPLLRLEPCYERRFFLRPHDIERASAEFEDSQKVSQRLEGYEPHPGLNSREGSCKTEGFQVLRTIVEVYRRVPHSRSNEISQAAVAEVWQRSFEFVVPFL